MQVQDTVDCNTDVVNMLSEKEKIVKSDLWVERASERCAGNIERATATFIYMPAVRLQIRKGYIRMSRACVGTWRDNRVHSEK
jgi:hypothetical protein